MSMSRRQQFLHLGLTGLITLAVSLPGYAESVFYPRLGYPLDGDKRVYLNIITPEDAKAEEKVEKEAKRHPATTAQTLPDIKNPPVPEHHWWSVKDKWDDLFGSDTDSADLDKTPTQEASTETAPLSKSEERDEARKRAEMTHQRRQKAIMEERASGRLICR